MHFERNTVLQSRHGRPFLADVCYQPTDRPQPIVIWIHGFMGFKDWGPYNVMAKYFAQAGFIFVKFNMSHNGTTIDQPVAFADTEAFGLNNFEKELDDLGTVIDWVQSDSFMVPKAERNTAAIYLIGHSRGGGIAILKAGEDKRIKKIATWASVNEFGKFWKADEMNQIKEAGVLYVTNSRTKQQLPVYWQLYDNYFQHPERLYIPNVVRHLDIPMLIVHGSHDQAVPVTSASEMKNWKPDAELMIIENGNHVFGGRHPWELETLPDDLHLVIDQTIAFFKKESE